MKKPFFYLTVLLCAGLLVSNVTIANTQSLLVLASQCACSNYLAERVRPDWVGIDNNDAQYYASSGSAACSTIQHLDFADSALNARSNLAAMLHSQINKTLQVKISDDSKFGGGIDADISIAGNSKALLKQSEIFDRWFDHKSCVLYSAVRLSKIVFQQTLNDSKRLEDSRLKNQKFSLVITNANARHFSDIAKQLITNSGATVYSNLNTTGTYVIAFRFWQPTVSYLEDFGNLVEARVTMSITSPDNRVLWNRTESGKVISPTANTPNAKLRAPEKALLKFKPELTKFLLMPLQSFSSNP